VSEPRDIRTISNDHQTIIEAKNKVKQLKLEHFIIRFIIDQIDALRKSEKNLRIVEDRKHFVFVFCKFYPRNDFIVSV
jgi:hypothetical protein